MQRVTPIRRVIVLDGLRPDANPRFGLHHTAALARRGASTMLGRTVEPSVTAAAMASLLTGATPERHGLQVARMPLLFSGIANRIAAHVGVSHARFSGRDAADILTAATATIQEQKRGLILLHWPDGDAAGHAHGWMSEKYADAVKRMDAEVGRLVKMLDLDDPATLLIALADHGGGDLGAGASLLDVPATVCWALGIPQSESFAGRPLSHVLNGVPASVAA